MKAAFLLGRSLGRRQRAEFGFPPDRTPCQRKGRRRRFVYANVGRLWRDADGGETPVGDDLSDAIAVAAFAPGGLAAQGVDFFEQALGEQAADDDLDGAALEPLRQRNAPRMLRRVGEDDQPGVAKSNARP